MPARTELSGAANVGVGVLVDVGVLVGAGDVVDVGVNVSVGAEVGDASDWLQLASNKVSIIAEKSSFFVIVLPLHFFLPDTLTLR